jgi:hypothetical protein
MRRTSGRRMLSFKQNNAVSDIGNSGQESTSKFRTPQSESVGIVQHRYIISGHEPHKGWTPRWTNWLAVSCRVTWTTSCFRGLRVSTALGKQLRQCCAHNRNLVEMLSPWSLSVNGKAVPLQALTGPERSRRLRLQDFKTVGT